MSYDGSLKFDTKIDESGFSSGISKLGSIAKGGMAVLGTAVAGTVTAFTALTKSSLEAVSSMEQNIGGVETLFKDSADTVIANANRAYQTAGMSANEYMSTVTSFSASLLQSLSGNTEEAARVADMAITDMSDNANKMGTSMESIQNAYQGFAKQNYTMLDNLKLGYGGTKTEMQRLLSDAQKLTGVKYDISNLNDVYEAIHVIQEDLGITGTTAKEAATTIEGSMSSAKAAWENFLAGSGSVDELVSAVSTAAGVIGKNLGEIVPRLLETVPAAVGALYDGLMDSLGSYDTSGIIDAGGEIVSGLVTGIADAAPDIINLGINLIQSLAGSLIENAPQIADSAGEILTALATGILTLIPTLGELAITLVTSFGQSIVTNAPTILSAGAELLNQMLSGITAGLPLVSQSGMSFLGEFLTGIVNQLPMLYEKGAEILTNLVNGILENIPSVIRSAGAIISAFAESIMTNMPSVWSTGVDLILSLVDGIVNNLPEIVSSAVQAVGDFASTILENLPQILETGISLLGELAAGIIQAVPSLLSKIPGIISDIKEEFTSIDWGEVGLNIIQGIANGITNAVGSLVEAAANAAESALEWVKEKLDIHSPSRRFRDEVGKMMALGMGIGFEDNIPVDDMGKSVDAIINKTRKRIAGIESVKTTGVGSIVKDVTNNYTGGTIDYKEIKKAQLEAMNEANEKPIKIGSRQLKRCLKDEGVVPTI